MSFFRVSDHPAGFINSTRAAGWNFMNRADNPKPNGIFTIPIGINRHTVDGRNPAGTSWDCENHGKTAYQLLVAVLLESDEGVSNHLFSIVFWFHHNSQKVIGSLWHLTCSGSLVMEDVPGNFWYQLIMVLHHP